jgi:hypothetical protein
MMALNDFLLEIDSKQTNAYKKMPLFDVAQTRRWNIKTKRYFVKVFYHTRGHFDRLLWMRLVFALTVEGKRQILQYVAEEAGLRGSNGEENRKSHEQLFERFA